MWCLLLPTDKLSHPLTSLELPPIGWPVCCCQLQETSTLGARQFHVGVERIELENNPILHNGWTINYRFCGSFPGVGELIDDQSRVGLDLFHWWVDVSLFSEYINVLQARWEALAGWMWPTGRQLMITDAGLVSLNSILFGFISLDPFSRLILRDIFILPLLLLIRKGKNACWDKIQLLYFV